MNEFQNLCPGCMRPLPFGAETCPHCSKSIHDFQHAPLLPLWSTLSNRYLVGCGRLASTDCAVYSGYDTALRIPVTINEFLPKNLVVRGEGESKVKIRLGYDAMYQTCLQSFVSLWKTLMSLGGTPALPNVKEIFFENGAAYAVCESFDSITLEEYFEAPGKKLDWQRIKAVFKPVLLALCKLNSLSVVHAAVSPKTLLLGADGKLHLSGFSIPQTKSDIIELHALSVPGYAPLELSDRRLRIGKYTDVYSAMAVMYKLLCGITPQNAADRAVSDMMIIPQEYAKELDEKTVSVILGALNIYPENRIQSVDALCDLLYSAQSEAEQNAALSDTAAASRKTTDAPQEKKPAEPEKTEKPPEKGGESDGVLTFKVAATVLLVAAMVFVTAYTTVLYKYFDVPFIDSALSGLSFLPMNGETHKTDAGSTTTEEPTEQTSNGPVEYVKVADFTQLTYRDILNSETFKNNYEIEFSFEASDEVEKNSIISQSVKAGESVPKGTKITVVVSSGKPYVVLRDVMGMKYEDAADVLTKDGFVVQKVIKKNNGTRVPGTVCTMSLVAGLEFEKGTTVTLTVWGEVPTASPADR